MPKLNQAGGMPLLVLLSVVGIIIFLVVSSTASFKDKLFGNLYQKPQSLGATSGDKYGVNAGGVVQNDPQYNSALALASTAGIGWLRTGGCAWGTVLASDPGGSPPYPASKYNWNNCDSFINNIVNNNHLSLLTNFFYSTPWCTASPPQDSTNIITGQAIDGAAVVKAEPCDYEKFKDFVTKLVARYGYTAHPEYGSDYGKGWVKYWEIGNEPDGSGAMLYYTAGSPPPTVAPTDTEREVNISSHYAHIVQVAHDAIKAADPSSQVVLGGMILPVSGGSDQQTNHPDNNLLDQILKNPPYNVPPYDQSNPAANNFDIMNFHCYCPTSTASTKLTQIYNSLKTAGVGSKPIWITEVGSGTKNGQTTSGYSCPSGQDNSTTCQQSQANYLTTIVPYFLNGVTASDGTLVKADKVFWYSLFDSPADSSGFCSYGLVWYGASNFQCGVYPNPTPNPLPTLATKLSFASYQSLIGPSVTSTPTPTPTSSLLATPTPDTGLIASPTPTPTAGNLSGFVSDSTNPNSTTNPNAPADSQTNSASATATPVPSPTPASFIFLPNLGNLSFTRSGDSSDSGLPKASITDLIPAVGQFFKTLSSFVNSIIKR
ncbi:hypothetical protein HY025_06045 [Candidatus Daviesbacteria bacterium]|nr:hypothetical protein [Candidatus Daviesbacteria bacterium]